MRFYVQSEGRRLTMSLEIIQAYQLLLWFNTFISKSSDVKWSSDPRMMGFFILV